MWCMVLPVLAAQAQQGHLRGIITDASTHAPIPGATVQIEGTSLGTSTDGEGRFLLSNIPAGVRSLRVSSIGYRTRVRTDLVLRPGQGSQIDVELEPDPVALDEQVVTASWFSDTPDAPLSAMAFANEEIRRSPGSFGDPGRIVNILPGVAKLDEQSNALAVRGGSPAENAVFIDDIEIPNLNHFPVQGTSAGGLSILNLDLVDQLEFTCGGFSPRFGSRISSVMDITLRKGNAERWSGKLDANLMGFGAVAEGPLPLPDGTVLVSVRRSYLDLVVDAGLGDIPFAPRYGDVQSKLSFRPFEGHAISLLGVVGDDHIESDREGAIREKSLFYGRDDIVSGALGARWHAMWSSRWISTTTLSTTFSSMDNDYRETGQSLPLMRNDARESMETIRHESEIQPTASVLLNGGIVIQRRHASYVTEYGAYTSAFGDSTQALILDATRDVTGIGFFVDTQWKLSSGLTLAIGARSDRFPETGEWVISPRGQLTWEIVPGTSASLITGIYHQSLPAIMQAFSEQARTADPLRSMQGILSLRHLLTEDTKLVVEGYLKSTEHCPIDPGQPVLFLLDEIYDRYGFYFAHPTMHFEGRARAYGIEATVQKKLARDVYGLVTASWSRSEYRGGDGIWRPRVYDNRVTLGVEGGYKPSEQWECSLRWVYAGGRPTTPFDMPASMALNRAVLDETRVNSTRLPDFHSLNLRVDRRFHFQRSDIVAWLSVWNVYDRKNVATAFWNQSTNTPDHVYQWSILPVFGVTYEF